jgi:hypothetical protein
MFCVKVGIQSGVTYRGQAFFFVYTRSLLGS